MSGAGSAEEPGILQRHAQGYVEPSRGLADPNVPLSAPSGVQLAPTSPKLVEGEFCELLRPNGVLRSSHAIRSLLHNPQNVHGHPNSRAATINPMPIVATFHTSERISGTPAA